MKKIAKSKRAPLTLSKETLRDLTLVRVRGGAILRAQSDDPCWTTRTSDGLPCKFM